MKNVKILKKVVPLLRDKEEIVSIPQKDKKTLILFIFINIFCASLLISLWFFDIFNFKLSEILLPMIVSSIIFIVYLFFPIASLNKCVIITNQRLVYFYFGKPISIERENIEVVTFYSCKNELTLETTLIKTKDSKSYKLEFYDYKQIKELLGL